MNLVENYIKEIHEIKEVKQDWGSFISADLTIDCYGRIERVKTSFMNWEEWESAKVKGFYLS